MSKKQILLYILGLFACFLLGCTLALGLRAWDAHNDRIVPISIGQTIDFSAYGFHLTVPEGYALNDYTTNNHAEGGSALFAGCAYGAGAELYIFCYANETGDDIRSYSEQELVSYYMSMGASSARIRTLGGRPFITYRVAVNTDNGIEYWDTYETWDSGFQLTVETQMAAEDVLPILATLNFTTE